VKPEGWVLRTQVNAVNVETAAPVNVPPPNRSGGTGQVIPVAFSTLVARSEILERIVEQWGSISQSSGMPGVPVPNVLPLSAAAAPFAQGALRVAVLRHRPGLAPTVVAALRTQLERTGISDVLVEEGYFLEPAARRGTAPRPATGPPWSVQWRPERLSMLREPISVALPATVIGAAFIDGLANTRRIALIDTGDEGCAGQICCEDYYFGPEQANDQHGHGTTVGGLIRLAAPDAKVDCYRVFRPPEEFAESGMLLNAVNHATLMSGEYAVVAIPARAVIGKAHEGRRDSIHRIISHNAGRGLPMPVVVCAAGNHKDQPMSYPAVVPGVVVALGLDWAGDRADYNCREPAGAGVYTVGAYGGVRHDSLGTATRPGRKAVDCYGSSYATALVAASLLTLPFR
jgi:hypothetical protein